MKLNFGSKNSAIGIILGMNLLFFGVWVTTLFLAVKYPALSEVTTKLYGVFMGVNNALMLVLNSEARNGSSEERSTDPPPSQPAGPAQPKL